MKPIMVAIGIAILIVGVIFGWLYKRSEDYAHQIEAARKQATLQQEHR